MEIDLEIVENDLLLKLIKKNVRENWEENIKQVFGKNKNKKMKLCLKIF